MRLYFVILNILVLGLLSSCVKRPDDVLSDKDMASVVADLKLAEAYMQTQTHASTTRNKEEIVEYIMAKHGLTRAQFDSTMSWYGRNMDSYYAMCELAEKELMKKKRKVAGSTSIEVETSDLWPYQRQAFMSSLSGSDAFQFSLPTSDVQKGQRINLKFRLNNGATGNALLGVEYDDGEKVYFARTLHQSKKVDLVFQTDTGKTVTRVYGNFLLADKQLMPLWLDSIYLQVLPYDTTQYFNIYAQRHYRNPTHRRVKTVDKLDTLSVAPQKNSEKESEIVIKLDLPN